MPRSPEDCFCQWSGKSKSVDSSTTPLVEGFLVSDIGTKRKAHAAAAAAVATSPVLVTSS